MYRSLCAATAVNDPDEGKSLRKLVFHSKIQEILGLIENKANTRQRDMSHHFVFGLILINEPFYNIIINMKTIAITVDEATLALIDELNRSFRESRSRSALIRTAIREYAEQMRRRLEEEKEREVIHKNKDLLDRQLKALIAEQERS